MVLGQLVRSASTEREEALPLGLTWKSLRAKKKRRASGSYEKRSTGKERWLTPQAEYGRGMTRGMHEKERSGTARDGSSRTGKTR